MKKSRLSTSWFSTALAYTLSVLRRRVWTSKHLRDDSCSCLSTWKTRRNGEERARVIALRYINARVSVRVNSQRGKNVKYSSFTRCCVVINNNGTVNYCVRASDVRTITGCDSHENIEIYQSYRCVNISANISRILLRATYYNYASNIIT